jgi:hypothetical protein
MTTMSSGSDGHARPGQSGAAIEGPSLAYSVLKGSNMRRVRGLFVVFVFTACSSHSTSDDTSDASVEITGLDASRDATRPDGSDGSAAACPDTASSGACSIEGQTCQYDCVDCVCTNGVWFCNGPGCAGGCGYAGPPPPEGEACGGCCGPSLGETCIFTCVGEDAGTVSGTCESSGWHMTEACPGAAADGGRDAKADGD